MIPSSLLIFDFDGVIVDGLNEYWWSARKASIKLLGGTSNNADLPYSVPQTFRELRPWVHHGWEMVLIASEMLRPESLLRLKGAKAFACNYHTNCQEALKAWELTSTQLQTALEDVRHAAIEKDAEHWLALHQPFPGLVKRLNQLPHEGLDWAVLTTKKSDFAIELLKCFHLKPNLVLGHDSGSKPEILLQLNANQTIRGFIEDRRATLETVLETPELKSIPCYLASWGYLKPNDKKALPPGIHLLEPETLASPLANWP